MPEHNYNRDALILLAEDNEGDIILFRRALKKAHITNPLEIVRDGDETVAYLKGEGRFADRTKYPLPALLLLDLKMPRRDGFQVLKWIRKRRELDALRVVVLTGSQDIYDRTRAYQLGANSFIVKTLDSQTFAQLVESIRGYWLTTDLTPQTTPSPPSNLPPS
jgi:CheY-like chemotaxis protein